MNNNMNNNFRMPNEPNYLKEKDLMRSGSVLKILGIGFSVVFFIIIIFEKGITENVIKLGLFLVIFWIFVAIMLFLKKIIYSADEISNCSVKVEGTITGFKMRYASQSEDTPRNIEVFNLTISYIDPKTNLEKEFETPLVNFNPVTDLGSKKCSVLIDGNKVYATDFVVGKNIGKCLWDNNDKSMIKYMKQKLNHNYENTISIILIILFLIFILSLIVKT